MYTGDNHEAVPMTTHGVLVGIEKEDHVDMQNLLDQVVEALIRVDGIGRVDAEYIGQMGDEKPIEDEVMETLMESAMPVKES